MSKNQEFNFCNQIDLHCLNGIVNLKDVVSVAAEHGFRGIVVHQPQIVDLVKCINDSQLGDKNIVPISVIDFPLGNSSTDVRAYGIASAKENGAKEVEVVAPYGILNNTKKFAQDIGTIAETARKVKIKLKYVIDQTCISNDIQTRLSRLIASNRLDMVSLSLGYHDKDIDHSDIIIRMRNIKNKSNAQIKMYLKDDDVDILSSYMKAGINIIGLDWDKAPNLAHAYENILQS